MLKLESQECTVEHVNFRTEKHGTDDVTAVDLKLSANMPPSVLEQMVPGMVDGFFKPSNSSGAMKGEKALRFPDLVNEFHVISDIPGYDIAIEWGMTGSLVEFAGVTVGKIKVELVDGGAVSLTLRVQVSGKPEELAKLVPLLSLKLPVSLTPPDSAPLPKGHPDHPDTKKPKSVAAVTKDAPGATGAQPPIGQGAAPPVDPLAKTDLAKIMTAQLPRDEAPPAGTDVGKMSEQARAAASKPLDTKAPKPGVH